MLDLTLYGSEPACLKECFLCYFLVWPTHWSPERSLLDVLLLRDVEGDSSAKQGLLSSGSTPPLCGVSATSDLSKVLLEVCLLVLFVISLMMDSR